MIYEPNDYQIFALGTTRRPLRGGKKRWRVAALFIICPFVIVRVEYISFARSDVACYHSRPARLAHPAARPCQRFHAFCSSGACECMRWWTANERQMDELDNALFSSPKINLRARCVPDKIEQSLLLIAVGRLSKQTQ